MLESHSFVGSYILGRYLIPYMSRSKETMKNLSIEDFEMRHELEKKKVTNAYVSVGLEPRFDANETVLQRFLKITQKGKIPIERSVNQIVRTRSKGKDYLYFAVIYSAFDRAGNFATASDDTIGCVFVPKVVSRNQVTDEGETITVSADVLDINPAYSIQFSKENLEALKPYLAEKLSLVVKAENRKYSGFSWDDFANRSMEELVLISRFGTIPERQARKAGKDAQEKEAMGQ
jgi:hypothetical protein